MDCLMDCLAALRSLHIFRLIQWTSCPSPLPRGGQRASTDCLCISSVKGELREGRAQLLRGIRRLGAAGPGHPQLLLLLGRHHQVIVRKISPMQDMEYRKAPVMTALGEMVLQPEARGSAAWGSEVQAHFQSREGSHQSCQLAVADVYRGELCHFCRSVTCR